jgi:VWFA-related protein
MQGPWSAATLALVALSLPAALPAAVAPKTVPSPPGFSEQVDVRAVNVEVVVTDRAGRLVSGLSAADFDLRVDGKPMTVDYFAEVADGRGAAGAVGTSYLVFIDDSFGIAAPRNVVLTRLAQDLSLLGPEDRMAIVSWNGSRLLPLSGWSGDIAALTAALEQARELPTRGLEALLGRRALDNEAALRAAQVDASLDQSSRNLGASNSLGDPVEAAVSELQTRGDALEQTMSVARHDPDNPCLEGTLISPSLCHRLEGAIDGAAAALRGLPVPGGRKVALLLSGGWPFGAGEAIWKPLVDTADQLGYTLYPVDLPGTSGNSFASWDGESRSTLSYLAKKTGGRPAIGSTRLAALKTAITDTRSYYTLGFSPLWRANDSRHALKVKVKGRGLNVRSRAGFTDLSPRSEVSLRAETALLFSGGNENRQLRLEIGPPTRHLFGSDDLPVTLFVPVSTLSLVPEGTGYRGEALVSFAVVDAKGGRATFSEVPLRLTLKTAPAPDGYARYQTTVQLPRHSRSLVALVKDRQSGATLWEQTAVGE